MLESSSYFRRITATKSKLKQIEKQSKDNQERFRRNISVSDFPTFEGFEPHPQIPTLF